MPSLKPEKPQVFISKAYPPSVVAFLKFQLKSQLTNFSIQTFNDQELLQEKDLRSCVGLLVRSQTKVTEQVFEKMPHLKVLATATSGFDHIDLQALKKSQATGIYTPEANADATADLTLWHILSSLRHLQASRLKQISWRADLSRGQSAKNLNLGILGFGRIGQRVAYRAAGFGFKTFYHDPYLLPEQEAYITDFGLQKLKHSPTKTKTLIPIKDLAEPLGLLEIFDHCDVISLHLPLTKKTREIINEKTLEHFGHDKVLINCARGDLIHEESLIKALDNGILSAAGLDVFSNEPLKPDSPLRQHQKITWTPHIGAYTEQAFMQSCQMAAQELCDFLFKENLPTSPLPPKADWVDDI